MFIKKIQYHSKNQRIDNFIRSNFYRTPKSLLYKMIRLGKIKINQRKITPCYKLQLGDILQISNIYLQEKKSKTLFLNKEFKKKLLSCILYEDKYLLIINKPSGIAVHGGSGLKFGIIEGLRILNPQDKYLELVHRLDRNTSGVLIIAKKKSSLKNLHEQFRMQKIQKKYLALTHGVFLKNKIIVSQPLVKKKLQNGKKIVTINQNGKKSISIFKVKKKFDYTTLVSITPKTGRTHQIRVHSAYIGYPIIFDHDYGNKILDKKIQKDNILQKILLHAKKITFNHPNNHKKITIFAPLEKRFQEYLKIL
ncbi:RluA family pseudouridine synthase [Buchnera aphidicola]|uniref:RluA family pseudouridine synthase n=1 Tax=Buchnera aphidicola TaxID=9 RepID=UPI003463DA90